MTRSRQRSAAYACAAVAVLVLAGCAGTPSAPSSSTGASSTTTASASSTSVQPPADGDARSYDVRGAQVAVSCYGQGSPTILILPGLNDGASSIWQLLAREMAVGVRACVLDRPGFSGSDERVSSAAVPVGTMAEEMQELLAAAQIAPPYVLVAHSFGGMIAEFTTATHPEQVAGLVLVDCSMPQELTTPYFSGIDWTEGASPVDVPATLTQAKALPKQPRIPTVVLTQDAEGDLADAWLPLQAGLAASYPGSQHLIVRGAGHGIARDAPDTVLAAVRNVVASATTGAALPACQTAYAALRGVCL